MKTPDLTQKVIGFRQWDLDEEDHLLRPVGMTSAPSWKPGPQHAICWNWERVGDTQALIGCIPVVNPYCECGFYGLRSLNNHRLQNAEDSYSSVVGIILGWGRMAIHKEGWRSQWVEIAALLTQDGSAQNKGFNKSIRKTAEKYGVPTVPWSKAEAYAEEFGATIPKEFYEWDYEETEAYAEAANRWRESRGHWRDWMDIDLHVGFRNRILPADDMLDYKVPEAMAACYDIYVPNPGELLEGINYGIEVKYLPEPEPIVPAEIDPGRIYELCVSDNATILHLPTRTL